jgi:hypothetical protein
LKAELKSLFDGVKDGSIPTNVGAVCAQIGGVRTRVLELERRVRETEEFEARLSQLEEVASTPGRRRAARW